MSSIADLSGFGTDTKRVERCREIICTYHRDIAYISRLSMTDPDEAQERNARLINEARIRTISKIDATLSPEWDGRL